MGRRAKDTGLKELTKKKMKLVVFYALCAVPFAGLGVTGT